MSYAAAAALLVASLVALWREAPTVSVVPAREIVSFAVGLVTAVAIAALMNVTREVTLPVRFALVAALGVVVGLLWRSKGT
jgi:hypothetical protein